MIRRRVSLLAVVALAAIGGGCAAAKDDNGEPADNGAGATASGAGGMTGASPASGSGSSSASGAGGSSTAGGGAGTSPGKGSGGVPAPNPSAPDEKLDPAVDWTALTLVYPTAYSAHDGVHTFQVPFYVDGATVELSDWSAIPASSVTFDADPDGGHGGVLVTVEEGAPEITIAARTGMIGGTATLHVTKATPEQWEAGKARYANGIEFNLPAFTPADFALLLLDPNWMPPLPPGDIGCNNCHTTGAKYFEIQHTPTQAARFSDEDLRTILTMGKKPDGVGFRVLPMMLGSKTNVEIYAQFHTWDSTEEEIVGLIVYLRSLTPTGQGDILLPDGTYVPVGTPLPMPAMP